jgi:hypothetical protein
MEPEEIRRFVQIASRGDNSEMERLFRKPGGRKFLETTILLLLQQLPSSKQEKIEYFNSFLTIMEQMEERLHHQKRGERILKRVFTNDRND